MSLPTLKKLDTHERTVVSTDNNALESDLSYKLNAVCKVIRQLIKSDPNIQTVYQLQQTGLESEVYDIIRSYVQQSYQLGTKYVADIARIEPLLTSLDIQSIKQMTDIFCAKFWGRVQLQVFDAKIPTSGLLEEMTLPNDSFNPNFIVNSLSIAITSQALNEATKTKAANISGLGLAASNVSIAELQAGTTYKSLHQRIVENYGNVPYTVTGQYPTDTININMSLDLGVVYMWVTTIDERTCPLCVSLHGQTWDLNDAASIPNIPDQTHLSCRCRILLVESDFAAKIAEEQATL
jgi:SPP1 gp7 family putative phage head morphogenesis protein